MLSFAVPTHTLGRDKAARKASDLELLEWQQQRAARLGLRWPPKPQNAKRPGRPTFARLWVLALEQAIRDGHLPEHVESAMPSWWRPGMPVWRSESDVAADMADAPCVGASLEPDVELIDLTSDPEDGELRATPNKRARGNEISPAVKEWFCNLTSCHPDWSIAECIRYAKRLAPELFQVHIQTPRKWLRSGHTHVRPAQRISEGISCGSSVFRFVFNQRLEALGCTYRFGPRDCRRFLRQMDLKWRQPAGKKRKWSDSDVREHRELTASKLVWTLNDACAHPSRLCNIDETATRLLPIGEKGWLRPGAAPMANKAYITTVLATRYGSPDLLAQCIFQEKKRACEPTHAFSSILTSHTDSHWSSSATLVDFVEFIDKTWFNPQEPPHTDAWVLLWDVCTTHTSRETLAELRSRLPHVRVTFLPPWLHKPHATVRHQLHAWSEDWPHPRSCQPPGLFAHHGPRRSHCSEAFFHGVEVHVPGLAAHNLGGDLDRSTQRRSMETPLATRRRVGLSTRSGANRPCRGQPVSLHTDDALLQNCCMLAQQNTIWPWVQASSKRTGTSSMKTPTKHSSQTSISSSTSLRTHGLATSPASWRLSPPNHCPLRRQILYKSSHASRRCASSTARARRSRWMSGMISFF